MPRVPLIAAIIVIVVAMAVPFAGPLSSGALLLLLPVAADSEPRDLPASYEPVHKGGINLATGLYTRRDEDLVLPEGPPLVLRRLYVSGYHVSREFGIGTTHSGEKGLAGDGKDWQWVLMYPSDSGMRVHFKRISPGRSFVNALYEHSGTSTEFQGARLGWIGFRWVMRLRDGRQLNFLRCAPTMRACPVIEERDGSGESITYRRNPAGRLLRMEARPNRWIAFDYDDRGSITRAQDSTGREVRYEYDAGGRLAVVRAPAAVVRRYTYTDRHEMKTIEQPDIFIENTYNSDGRVIRQVNRFPGESAPYTFDFTYRTTNNAVHSTEVRRSDTTWTIYTFDSRREITSESWGSSATQPVSVKYERNPETHAVTSVNVTCADRTGQPSSHPRRVSDGKWQRERDDLIEIYCSSGWRSQREVK